MAIKIRENKNLKGLEIKLDGKSNTLKICQLADDTTLFLQSKKKDVTLAINLIEIFGTFSGLKLNKTMNEGIWLGQLKHCRDKCEDINWFTTPIKTLGIYFGHNKQACQKLNFEKQLLKCKKIIADWSKRKLLL